MTTLPFRCVYSVSFDFIRFLLSIIIGHRAPPGVCVCVCVRACVWCVCVHMSVCVRVTLLTTPWWQWHGTQWEM